MTERRIHKLHRRVPVKARPPNLPAGLEVKKSSIRKAGKGLFAKQKLKRRHILGEYVGEVLTYAQSKDRDPSYFIHTSEDKTSGFVVDGVAMTNPMRWLNHSKKPNTQAELQTDGRILFVTTKPVKAGEELFIDYGYDP
jgi:uncharacterized protein